MKLGLRFSAKAARNSIRSDLSPCSCSLQASALLGVGWLRPHLAHHVHGIDARGRRQCEQMVGHGHRRRDQLRLGCKPVEETDLVEPLGGEAEAQRHLHGDRIGHVGEMAMVVAAEQPALGLRYLETASGTATRRSVRSTSMKPPPMAKPLTAAITGFSSVPSMNGSGTFVPPGFPVSSVSFMSSPAQKPRPCR